MQPNSQSIYCAVYEAFLPAAPFIKSTITKLLPVDYIFFLGGSLLHHDTGTIFLENIIGQTEISKYYLLILSTYSGEYEINEMESIIEQQCSEQLPVTVMIMRPEIFNSENFNKPWLNAALKRPGCCIYNSNKFKKFTSSQYNRGVWNEENEKNFAYGWKLTHSFFEGASFYRLTGQLNIAAFMLHQSAEHALKTIEHICMGDAVEIHDIARLIQLTAMFHGQLEDVFSMENIEDQKLLQLLDRSYLDARYSPDFSIEDKEVLMLSDRIKLIHIILQDVWKQYKESILI